MFEGLQKFFVIKAVRWGATMFAGTLAGAIFANSTIMGYIQQACAAMSSQEKLEGGIVAAAVGLATLLFSFKDVLGVNAKNVTAAVTGSVEAANDPTIRKEVMAAVKSGATPPPSPPPPNIDDIIAARQAAARGGE